jgi:hypothetical protein
MHAAAASGALVSVNHPKPFGPAWDYPDARGFHAVEVWNGGWNEGNDASLAWWDSLLRAGRRVVAVGGSDTHHLKQSEPSDSLGRPTTWAEVGEDRSVAGVLSAVREGKVCVSRDVDGPRVFLSRERVRVVNAWRATLTLVSRRGVESAQTVTTDDWTTALPTSHDTYVRAQVRLGNEMLALSNPVWF